MNSINLIMFTIIYKLPNIYPLLLHHFDLHTVSLLPETTSCKFTVVCLLI